MATGFIGHLSQVFCTRSHGAIDCKKTAGEQTTGFCAFWTGRIGCATMCFLYELLKVFFFLKYWTRIEFVLCIVVQHPDAKTVGILEKNPNQPNKKPPPTKQKKKNNKKTQTLNFRGCLGSLLLECVNISSLSFLEWPGKGDKGAWWQSSSMRGLFLGYYN